MHQCSAACTAGWSSGRKCHCRLCGGSFSCPSNFDKHFERKGESIRCMSAEEAGLVPNKHGVLVTPGETDWDARFQQ